MHPKCARLRRLTCTSDVRFLKVVLFFTCAIYVTSKDNFLEQSVGVLLPIPPKDQQVRPGSGVHVYTLHFMLLLNASKKSLSGMTAARDVFVYRTMRLCSLCHFLFSRCISLNHSKFVVLLE